MEKRGRVPNQKEQQRTKRSEDYRGDGETHQNGDQGLAKADVQSEQRREHSIEQSIAQGGEQEDERQLGCSINRLQGGAPGADGRAEQARPDENNYEVKNDTASGASLNRGVDRLGFASKQNGNFAQVQCRGAFHLFRCSESCL